MKWSKFDKRWRELNKKLFETKDSFGKGVVYRKLANQLDKEGKDNSKLLDLEYEAKKKSMNETVLSFKSSEVVESVEVLATSDSCSECLKVDGKRQSIRNALSNPLIPIRACTHKYGCRCTYIPVLVGEK